MLKKKSLVLTTFLLALVFALSCLVMTACGSTKETHTITWTYDSTMVTVTSTDGEALPTELEEEETYSFNITAVTGYTLGTVTGAKKQDDGTYMITMGTSDITVKINASKTLNSITVTQTDTSIVYFEGDTVDKSTLTVVANYALGDETVTDYTISYANGTTFMDGDTYFTVTYSGQSYTVELAQSVSSKQTFTSAELILVDNGDAVALKVNGYYSNTSATLEEAEEDLETWFNDCTERGSWTSMTFTVSATVSSNYSFELILQITDACQLGYQYYFHYGDGSDGQDFTCDVADGWIAVEPGSSNTAGDFVDELVIPEGATYVETNDGTKWYLGCIANWGSNAMVICPLDDSKTVSYTNVTLTSGSDNGLYLQITGTCGSAVTADSLTADFYLDMQSYSNSYYYRWVSQAADADTGAVANFTVSVDASTGTFTILCDLTKVPTIEESDTLTINDTTLVTSSFTSGDIIYAHIGSSTANMSTAFTAASVTYNGLVYTIGAATEELAETSWLSTLTFIYVTAA